MTLVLNHPIWTHRSITATMQTFIDVHSSVESQVKCEPELKITTKKSMNAFSFYFKLIRALPSSAVLNADNGNRPKRQKWHLGLGAFVSASALVTPAIVLPPRRRQKVINRLSSPLPHWTSTLSYTVAAVMISVTLLARAR
jgi:hypothetical protein